MIAKPSKQLGAMLGRVPPATAAGQGPEPARPVAYAPEVREQQAAPIADSTVPEPAPEVPLQVLVPRHVRDQLDAKRVGKDKKSIRQLVLEALREAGYVITDEDVAGPRGRRKS